MSDEITLDDVKAFAKDLGPWAYVVTVGADGHPDVVPVQPGWEGDTLWVMTEAKSVKARNIAANPNVALQRQVAEAMDGVELLGIALLSAGSNGVEEHRDRTCRPVPTRSAEEVATWASPRAADIR